VQVQQGNDETMPLIPDVAGLTKKIAETLKGNEGAPSDFEKLSSQLKEDNPEKSHNIEDILSHLRSLRQIAGKGTVRDFVAKQLDDLDEQICKIISTEVDKELPIEDSPYHNLAIWARSIPRIKPVHIFTTNYDLLIEQALEESACPYFDGFIGSKNAFFDLGTVENEALLHPRWCRLWKIHGSINWKIDKEKRIVRSNKTDKNESYLIYPSHLKYDQSRKMPYLAMLDRLKDFILTPSSILFLSGYSFSDDHINDVLLQSLRSNPNAMSFAFLFGSLDDDKYLKAKECAKQIPNLSLIAYDKGIIGRQEGEWTLINDDLIGEIPAQVIGKKDSEEDIETIRYEFSLGNFAKFGQFLKEMSVNPEENKDEE